MRYVEADARESAAANPSAVQSLIAQPWEPIVNGQAPLVPDR